MCGSVNVSVVAKEYHLDQPKNGVFVPSSPRSVSQMLLKDSMKLSLLFIICVLYVFFKEGKGIFPERKKNTILFSYIFYKNLFI